MQRLLALWGATLCFSVAAAAQDNSAVLATPRPASAAPRAPAFNHYETTPWQLAVSYEYFRADAPGAALNLNGFKTSVTRFAGPWLGFEAEVGAAWGSVPNGPTAKFLWYGAGPHIAFRRNMPRSSPGSTVCFGGAHLFPQTAFGSPNAFGYVVGGGVDIKLSPQVFWRVQADFVGTHFFNQWQNNEQVKLGLVFNF